MRFYTKKLFDSFVGVQDTVSCPTPTRNFKEIDGSLVWVVFLMLTETRGGVLK